MEVKNTDQGLDLIWGTSDIGKAIGRSSRQVHYMVNQGKLPVKKINGRWCTERGQLTRWFMDQLSAEAS